MDNQPTAHNARTARCVLGAVVCAANSRRAPPHAVGRRSSPLTPRFVGGCGFESSLPSRSRPVTRGARALHHVDNQPTAQRALVSARCVLGAVVCAANSRRAPPHAFGPSSSPTTLCQVGGCGFGMPLPSVFSPVAHGPRALRHVENQPTVQRACTSRCVLGAVVCAANSRRAPPHAVGRGSSPLTPRFVGGCGFESSWPYLSHPVTRGARALRHVDNRPTAQRALVSARCVLGAVVCAANSRRAPPHAFGRSSSPPTLCQVGGCGFETSLPPVSSPVARGRRALHHVENQPTAHRALVSARCVLGAVVCAANSRRAPPHAVGRSSSPPTPCQVGGCGFGPSLPSVSSPVARGPRALRHVENQPTAQRACTSRCVLGAVVCAANSRRAPPHAVGRSSSPPKPCQVGGCGFGMSLPSVSSPVARGPRALRHVENQPTVQRACTLRCVLGAVVCAANSRRAPPHAVGRGSSPLTPRFVGGCGFESSWPYLSHPVTRGARALRHVDNRPTAQRALVSARCVLGAVVCAANSRRAPPHAFGRSSSPPTLCQVGGCGFETSLPPVSSPVALGRRALHHVENQPTAHRALVSARCVLGAVVCAANSRRAPPHAVGRSSSPPTPCQVGGCGFGPSLPSVSSPVARGPRALRHVENQPTVQRALYFALRAWRGCLRGQLATRSTPRRWPKLFSTETVPGRRLRLRNVVAVCF